MPAPYNEEEARKKLAALVLRWGPVVATATMVIGFTVFLILVLTGHASGSH